MIAEAAVVRYLFVGWLEFFGLGWVALRINYAADNGVLKIRKERYPRKDLSV